MPTAASTSRSSWSCRSARRRFAEAVRTGAEIFHTLRGILKKKGYCDRRRRRRRIRAQPVVEPRSARRRHGSGRAGGYKPGDDVYLALDVGARASCGTTPREALRVQEVRREGPQRRRDGRAVRGLGAAVSDHLDRGRPRRRRLGRLEGADARRSAIAVQLVGDDVFVTNPAILEAGHRRGHRQRDARQAESDRHRDRNARRRRDGARRRLRQRHLAPLGRDRRHDHRRPRGRPRVPGRSRPDRPAAPIASRSTTSCSASKKSSARPRVTPGESAISSSSDACRADSLSSSSSSTAGASAPDADNNAIALARTPVYDELLRRYPHAQLIASGEAVGLPAGQMGNSEVGHMNMGAGRIVYQDLTRIDKSIRDGELFDNPVLGACDGSLRRRSARAAPHRSALRRRRPQPPASSARAHRNGGAPRACPRVHPRDHRRPRHLADRRRPLHRAARGGPRAAGDRTRRDGDRPLLRDGPRQALGADASSPTTRSSTGRPRRTASVAALRAIEQSYAAGDHRRVHQTGRDHRRRPARRSGRFATATRSSSSTSARTARGSSPARLRSTSSTASSARIGRASTARP